MPKILFVCTANQCRSPMAEALFKNKLAQAGITGGWSVQSAAAWGQAGERASEKARAVAAENGLDLDPHRSRRIEDLDLESFDLILVMQTGHHEALRAEFPQIADRVHMLTSLAGSSYDVRDPVGEDLESYRRTWVEIDQLLEEGFEAIVEQAGASSPDPTQ